MREKNYDPSAHEIKRLQDQMLEMVMVHNETINQLAVVNARLLVLEDRLQSLINNSAGA